MPYRRPRKPYTPAGSGGGAAGAPTPGVELSPSFRQRATSAAGLPNRPSTGDAAGGGGSGPSWAPSYNSRSVTAAGAAAGVREVLAAADEWYDAGFPVRYLAAVAPLVELTAGVVRGFLPRHALGGGCADARALRMTRRWTPPCERRWHPTRALHMRRLPRLDRGCKVLRRRRGLVFLLRTLSRLVSRWRGWWRPEQARQRAVAWMGRHQPRQRLRQCRPPLRVLLGPLLVMPSRRPPRQAVPLPPHVPLLPPLPTPTVGRGANSGGAMAAAPLASRTSPGQSPPSWTRLRLCG